jgi:hypothetical protein
MREISCDSVCYIGSPSRSSFSRHSCSRLHSYVFCLFILKLTRESPLPAVMSDVTVVSCGWCGGEVPGRWQLERWNRQRWPLRMAWHLLSYLIRRSGPSLPLWHKSLKFLIIGLSLPLEGSSQMSSPCVYLTCIRNIPMLHVMMFPPLENESLFYRWFVNWIPCITTRFDRVFESIRCINYGYKYYQGKTLQISKICEISDSHGGQDDDCLLGCCAASTRRNWPTFRRRLLPPSSGRW